MKSRTRSAADLVPLAARTVCRYFARLSDRPCILLELREQIFRGHQRPHIGVVDRGVAVKWPKAVSMCVPFQLVEGCVGRSRNSAANFVVSSPTAGRGL